MVAYRYKKIKSLGEEFAIIVNELCGFTYRSLNYDIAIRERMVV